MPFTKSERYYVCRECVEDLALAQVVEDNLDSESCDYCRQEADEPIAAPVYVVAAQMRRCIETFWTEPVDELLIDDENGGFYGKAIASKPSRLIF